jgi:hypothetical protein
MNLFAVEKNAHRSDGSCRDNAAIRERARPHSGRISRVALCENAFANAVVIKSVTAIVQPADALTTLLRRIVFFAVPQPQCTVFHK